MLVRSGLFLLLTLFLTMALGGIQQATGLLSGQVILPQLAPGLAALVMLLVFRKDPATPDFSLRPLAGKAALLAVLIPTGVALVIFIIVTQITGVLAVATISMADRPVTLIGMVIGAIGEELGWRGYWHKLLDRRWAGWASALMVGVPWALWHMQLYQYGLVYMIFAVILVTAYSFLIYAVVRRTGFNIWVAALFHLMINLTNIPFLSVMQQTSFMIASALAWAAAAGIAVALDRVQFLTRPSIDAPLSRRVATADEVP